MSGTTLEPSSKDHTETEEVIEEGRDSTIEPSPPSKQFGSEDVFTKIPNQSSSVEGVLNLEPDPFIKRLPHRHNRAIPNSVQEALADPRMHGVKKAMSEGVQIEEVIVWIEAIPESMVWKETGMLRCQPTDTPIEEGLKLCVEPNQVSIDKGKYQRLVGRLMYLAHIKPNLAYALSVAGAVDDRRSTSGYFTFVGGNLVTWKSKKQNVVARSSAKAEFRDMALGLSTCDIAHNPIQHDRTKHVEVDRFFIKEKLDDKIVELPKIRSEDQLTDILTKAAVSNRVFSKFLDKLDMCDIYAST
ncbi:Retrovirus-related Pol polyprotein from transposon RE2 [Vitis vinifera]|uniref:Retrovirus-related Pol polyprotein from transposon RE2 n=1 Tax=Vitis vinifera TaxID=29760 RepID=A0A438FE64_VITVI|nr:Retrovirus-related Pol polyprotein from transposon RE2 [Vitis vinifera]